MVLAGRRAGEAAKDEFLRILIGRQHALPKIIVRF